MSGQEFEAGSTVTILQSIWVSPQHYPGDAGLTVETQAASIKAYSPGDKVTVMAANGSVYKISGLNNPTSYLVSVSKVMIERTIMDVLSKRLEHA